MEINAWDYLNLDTASQSRRCYHDTIPQWAGSAIVSQGFQGRFGVRGAEDAGAGDEDRGAGTGAGGGGVEIDAAVHFDVIGEAQRIPQAPQALQFGQRLGHEGLAAEAGLHAHDQHHIA